MFSIKNEYNKLTDSKLGQVAYHAVSVLALLLYAVTIISKQLHNQIEQKTIITKLHFLAANIFLLK